MYIYCDDMVGPTMLESKMWECILEDYKLPQAFVQSLIYIGWMIHVSNQMPAQVKWQA